MKKHSEGAVAGEPARAADTRVLADGADEAVPFAEQPEAAPAPAPAPVAPEPVREPRRITRHSSAPES